MELGLILGLILILGAYMGLLVYYDGILRLRFPPLLVGIKGRIYPLEELIIGKKIKGQIDPLELESIYTRRDQALGYTSVFITTVSVLGAAAIIMLIIVGETLLIIIPLSLILYLHLYVYNWSRNVRITHYIRESEDSYIIGIDVKASINSKIMVVNEPPVGEVYGPTRAYGEGHVRLEYIWKPIQSKRYSWKPQLILVEEAEKLMRLDFSKNITFTVEPALKVEARGKEGKKGFGEHVGLRLFGTIREPEVVGVREYMVGDRLKDIISKSLLKPGGPRVRKYKELLEGSTRGEEVSHNRIAFILGDLARLSSNYRGKILSLIQSLAIDPRNDIRVFIDVNGELYEAPLDGIIEIDLDGLRKLDDSIPYELDRVFIDPSITVGVPLDKTVVVLPYDWRVEVLESYRNAWKKYLGEIEDAFGYVEKI